MSAVADYITRLAPRPGIDVLRGSDETDGHLYYVAVPLSGPFFTYAAAEAVAFELISGLNEAYDADGVIDPGQLPPPSWPPLGVWE